MHKKVQSSFVFLNERFSAVMFITNDKFYWILHTKNKVQLYLFEQA